MTTQSADRNILQFVPIVVGWLLGILSAIILDKLRKWFLKREIKKGIMSEIKELQLHLTAICINTVTNSATVTLEWSKWVRPYYEQLIGTDAIDYLIENKEQISNILKFTDDQFYTFLLLMQDKKDERVNLTFTRISTPYLNSKYESISTFKQEFQLLITKLRREIEFLNNDFDQCWFYHSKTFDKITDLNLDVVRKNIDQIIKRISRRTKGTIKLIQKIIDF